MLSSPGLGGDLIPSVPLGMLRTYSEGFDRPSIDPHLLVDLLLREEPDEEEDDDEEDEDEDADEDGDDGYSE